jgi:hypothetical protein
MQCYRQGIEHAHINTNNLIEAWHRTLKMHFFRDKQQRRADKVIYILTNDALTFFEQKDVNVANNIGASSPEQKHVGVAIKKALLHARSKKRSFVSFLHTQSQTVVSVESFENPNNQYEVQLDFSTNSAGEINSCSCPVFTSEKKCCKHIGMVILAYDRYPVFKCKQDWEVLPWEPQENLPADETETAVVNNQDPEPGLNQDTEVLENLDYQIDDIIQFFSTRDPNQPLSGRLSNMIREMHLEIREHGYVPGSRERQQKYKKRRVE